MFKCYLKPTRNNNNTAIIIRISCTTKCIWTICLQFICVCAFQCVLHFRIQMTGNASHRIKMALCISLEMSSFRLQSHMEKSAFLNAAFQLLFRSIQNTLSRYFYGNIKWEIPLLNLIHNKHAILLRNVSKSSTLIPSMLYPCGDFG